MNDITQTHQPEADNQLSLVLIHLMKGVLFRDEHPKLWHQLVSVQTQVRDYIAVLGLSLALYEDEGFAWLQNNPIENAENEQTELLPRLITRRQLSYPVSLLLALLRKKLVEHDSQSSDSRLIIERDDVVEMMRTFLAGSFNEARLVDQIDSTINKVVELGFARRLKNAKHKIEVRRIIVAFVNAQWLKEFDQRLADYAKYVSEETAE